MGEQENRRLIERLRSLMGSGEMETVTQELYDSSTDDFVQHWPQSGELIRGRDNARKLGEMYKASTGTNPKLTERRLTGSGDIYTVEGTIDYGDGIPVSYVGIWEFRDGKIAKLTEYFANPFEAPAWRAQWVERTDLAGVAGR